MHCFKNGNFEALNFLFYFCFSDFILGAALKLKLKIKSSFSSLLHLAEFKEMSKRINNNH